MQIFAITAYLMRKLLDPDARVLDGHYTTIYLFRTLFAMVAIFKRISICQDAPLVS